MSVRLWRGAVLACCILAGCSGNSTVVRQPAPPSFMLGRFTDDYDIDYLITPTLFQLGKSSRYNITEWNIGERHIIARADSSNAKDAMKWVRIDWMEFANMKPYEWGFCLATWTASTVAEAKAASISNRSSPKDGCGGYPFSRMRRVVQTGQHPE